MTWLAESSDVNIMQNIWHLMKVKPLSETEVIKM